MNELSNNPSEALDPDAMILVMCSDKNYAMPLCVTICSIAINLKAEEKAIIYLLDAGMIPHERERLIDCVQRQKKQVRLEFYPVDINQLNSIKQVGFYGAGTYIRLFIPTLLPAEIRKILFLDSDLVARTSVSGLWDAPLNGMPVAGIADQYLLTMGAKMAPIDSYGLTDLDPTFPYCNAGVMVWDLAKWREESIAQKMTDFLHQYADKLKWADQDALNVVLAGRICVLDPKWNYQYGSLPPDISMPEKLRRLSESHIVHYTGPNKPWTPGRYDPERREFLKYLKFSGWMSDEEFSALLKEYRKINFRMRYVDPIAGLFRKITSRLFKG